MYSKTATIEENWHVKLSGVFFVRVWLRRWHYSIFEGVVVVRCKQSNRLSRLGRGRRLITSFTLPGRICTFDPWAFIGIWRPYYLHSKFIVTKLRLILIGLQCTTVTRSRCDTTATAAAAAALESKSSFPFLGGQSGCKVAR